MIEPERADVSVLIGLVSTEDSARIFETLEALECHQGSVACEVVLVDRRQDELSREIVQRYPKVSIIPCEPGTSLPEMRTIALEASSAAIVAVTEDHCVPAANWLEQILYGFRSNSVVAVGGCVDNGERGTPFDWATFLCEYSYFFPPVAEGEVDVLPGMNVAYRRSALLRLPREALLAGFWETTVHPTLRSGGKTFMSINAMRMKHCKKFSVALFTRQRYVYSRYYAGIRFPRSDVVRRFSAAMLSFALPPLLLWRMYTAARQKGLQTPFLQAFPALSFLVMVWSFGELIGYLAGPGQALAEIE